MIGAWQQVIMLVRTRYPALTKFSHSRLLIPIVLTSSSTQLVVCQTVDFCQVKVTIQKPYLIFSRATSCQTRKELQTVTSWCHRDSSNCMGFGKLECPIRVNQLFSTKVAGWYQRFQMLRLQWCHSKPSPGCARRFSHSLQGLYTLSWLTN